VTFDALSLVAIAAIFLGAAGIVAVCGVLITGDADRLADKSGLGEALIGAVVLGATTSLSGSVVSITAALDGRASLAFANGVGGIAAQTAFLAVGDLVYRRVNLEHAAAEIANIFQAALLCLMLAVPLLAITGPELQVFGLNPASLALPVIYVMGVRTTARARADPMWTPVRTPETREDTPDEPQSQSQGEIVPLVLRFAGLALVLAVAGWTISKTGAAISGRVGISQTAVGALMTAVATSLPELVTTLAAVRRGAVQLAVGGIVGGNSFDVLFLTASDIAYRDGAFYQAISPADPFWLVVGIAMTAVLLLGLVLRQREGPGYIGFESVAILGIYGFAIAAQAFMG
jgi:cation:H+ antiporter